MRITEYDLEKARHVKAMIEKDLSIHYTYHELAKLLGISISKLQKSFKTVTGTTLYEYLTLIRVESAKHLLEKTDLTINAIADKVGWDRSNLNKQFKKAKGKTPGNWRDEQENDNFLIS